jgi:hypothetical protein
MQPDDTAKHHARTVQQNASEQQVTLRMRRQVILAGLKVQMLAAISEHQPQELCAAAWLGEAHRRCED